jgi:predicted nucleotidyltransferase
MRLTDEQVRSIREVVGRHFGTESRIWLFGSRSDDSRSGGDIDLYLEPERIAGSNLFLAKQAARHELEQKLHWPVDLVVRRDRETAFMRAAKSDGIPL